jgi:hypothetical protein
MSVDGEEVGLGLGLGLGLDLSQPQPIKTTVPSSEQRGLLHEPKQYFRQRLRLIARHQMTGGLDHTDRC